MKYFFVALPMIPCIAFLIWETVEQVKVARALRVHAKREAR